MIIILLSIILLIGISQLITGIYGDTDIRGAFITNLMVVFVLWYYLSKNIVILIFLIFMIFVAMNSIFIMGSTPKSNMLTNLLWNLVYTIPSKVYSMIGKVNVLA